MKYICAFNAICDKFNEQHQHQSTKNIIFNAQFANLGFWTSFKWQPYIINDFCFVFVKVLPYFLKSEKFDGLNGEGHGGSGYLPVQAARYTTPMEQVDR